MFCDSKRVRSAAFTNYMMEMLKVFAGAYSTLHISPVILIIGLYDLTSYIYFAGFQTETKLRADTFPE